MTPEQLARLAQLEARVGALEQAAGLDEPFLRRLFPAMAALYGSEWFTLAEAQRHAGVRLVIAGRSSTALGKLFVRAVGLVIGGYELERGPRHGSRTLWRLHRRRAG